MSGRYVTLDELEIMAEDARCELWEIAKGCGREPKIYLHWTAGRYATNGEGGIFGDYHINIDGDGGIYVTTNDLTDIKNHTWRRNTGAIGIALCCCYNATTSDLDAGGYAPTAKQIEVMAQVIDRVANALWLTIDIAHVMTHGEAADNADGAFMHEPYGPLSTVERWDLQFLGTPESPRYLRSYDDPATGGNVLRGKANWYMHQRKG